MSLKPLSCVLWAEAPTWCPQQCLFFYKGKITLWESQVCMSLSPVRERERQVLKSPESLNQSSGGDAVAFYPQWLNTHLLHMYLK